MFMFKQMVQMTEVTTVITNNVERKLEDYNLTSIDVEDTVDIAYAAIDSQYKEDGKYAIIDKQKGRTLFVYLVKGNIETRLTVVGVIGHAVRNVYGDVIAKAVIDEGGAVKLA